MKLNFCKLSSRFLKWSTCLLCALSVVVANAQTKVIWEIGKSDNQSTGMALAPADYKRFLEFDFGWEDRYFLIGHSKPEKDFPYVLPGPKDVWGGTAPNSGIRSHLLNILFGIDKKGIQDQYKLVVDMVGYNVENPPLFKVLVNGKPFISQLPKSAANSVLTGSLTTAKEYIIEIPIDPNTLRTRGNEIQLTSLDGSWLVFDQVRLEGPASTTLKTPADIFIRETAPATYELDLDGKRIQPLLVDIEHLSGQPKLELRLDGKTIFGETIEKGRYQFEVPMPSVSKTKQSKYEILANGRLIESGMVARSPQKVAILGNVRIACKN